MMRTLFDTWFAKITGKEIDGAGNWLACVTAVFAASYLTYRYRKRNDELRLKVDDLMTYRDLLRAQIAQIQDESRTKAKVS